MRFGVRQNAASLSAALVLEKGSPGAGGQKAPPTQKSICSKCFAKSKDCIAFGSFFVFLKGVNSLEFVFYKASEGGNVIVREGDRERCDSGVHLSEKYRESAQDIACDTFSVEVFAHEQACDGGDFVVRKANEEVEYGHGSCCKDSIIDEEKVFKDAGVLERWGESVEACLGHVLRTFVHNSVVVCGVAIKYFLRLGQILRLNESELQGGV